VSGDSTGERRERLDAITARIKLMQHTAEDVLWLRGIAEEYISNWERAIARMRRRTERTRSTAWPTTAADIAREDAGRRPGGTAPGDRSRRGRG
jgi:hypothetical protein